MSITLVQKLKQYEKQIVFLRWGSTAEYGKIKYVGIDFVEFEVLDIDTMEYTETVIINTSLYVIHCNTSCAVCQEKVQKN